MQLIAGIAGVITLIMLTETPHAATVTASERHIAHQWAAAKFEGIVPSAQLEPGLIVLENHGPVQMNSRAGAPLKIGDAEYAHGLYCHAVSRVVVRLPSAGKTFTSVVGVDSHAGGGSIVFSVTVGGKEAFNSGVRRISDPGLPIRVDLGGATQFTLEVGDAGDGISCDQADWADAMVALESGDVIRLGDMPFGSEHSALTADPPFSFSYDGRPSAEILKTWEIQRASRNLDSSRIERTVTYTDPKTGLIVRCVGIEYLDFPTVEWTVYFRNAGAEDTPVLSDIQALDMHLKSSGQGDFILHHHTGTLVSAHDFEPHETPLKARESMRFAPPGGRPLGTVFPYFNVECENQGVIVVVGWPGQWAAQFTRDEALGLDIRAGQELTHLRLHPGEEVRTPLIVLQFWQGDRIRSQNIWRRWMLAHNLPRYAGKLPDPQMPAVSGNQFPGLLCNEKDEILYLDRYAEEGIRLDYWWMDAGWYPNKGDWTSTGTWEVDASRFPHGLRAVTDHAHAQGVKSIVWFEPERVTPGSWLYENHPEWLLGKDGEQKLLDLGNPQAREWLTNHFDRLITEQGIDAYRQDFNIDPLPYWRANDAEDRRGITENRYVTGYLAFWDELRRRHPNMLIDSCASGGHRNDLETMRRSVPLLRSDYILDPIGEQGHTYGLAFWLPYYGTGFIDFDTYIFRSTMCPNTTLSCDARRKDLDWDLLRRLTAQWRQVAHYYFGDYYPLTRYSLDSDQWMAWQFDRPDLGEGMMQAFRRPESPYESARFKLRGLIPDADYQVTNLDIGDSLTMSGSEMTERGLSLVLKNQPDSVIIVYKRVKE